MKKYRDFNLKLAETEGIVAEFRERFDGRILHSNDELCVFYEMAYGIHADQPGYIYHAGIFQGGSLCLMGLGLRQAILDGYEGRYNPIVAIDPYGGYNEWTSLDNLIIAKEQIHKFGLMEYICPILYWCNLIFQWKIHYNARLIFIDTGHFYESTKLEIENAVPMIVESGWMLFHDFGDAYPGVRQAIEEFMHQQTEFEILDTFVVKNGSVFGMHLKRMT